MKRQTRSAICFLIGAFVCTMSSTLSLSVGPAAAVSSIALREPPLALGGLINSSSCVTGPVCVSIGWNHHGNAGYYWAARWRDQQWSKLPAPPNDGSAGIGNLVISCATTTWCMSTGSTGISPGNHPLADELIGLTWKSLSVPTPKGSTDFSLNKLDCRTTTWCIATGSYVANKPDYIDATFLISEVWNGSKWHMVSIYSPRTYAQQIDPGMTPGGDHPTASPQQLSCVSKTFCVITGFWNGVFVEQWNGRRWSEETAPNYAWRPPGDSEFSGGTCVSTTNCLGTGGYAVSNGAWRPLIERWNGQTWKIVVLPKLPTRFRHGVGFRLTQVDCASAKFCVALGDPRFANTGVNGLKWNGRTWSYVTVAGSRATPVILCWSKANCELID
jgi:hypothetical protein